MNDVFSKTGKGQDEIRTRAAGLTQRVRQVLIFVDGKRDINALRKMLPADDIADTLKMLQEQGYIEAVGTIEAPVSEPAQDMPAEKTLASAGAVFRELPPTPTTQELELARNFMMNTLKSFTGLYSSLSLVEKVNAAQSHAEMRLHFAPWINAITETRDGKRRADELRRSLLEII
jgi:hypothetical protein